MITSNTRWIMRLALGALLCLLFSEIYRPTVSAATPFPPTGVWTQYTNANLVKDIAWHDGVLWAATHGGLVRWQPSTGTYTKYTTIDGLPSDDLHQVAVNPSNGDVWVGTRFQGVAVRHPNNTWDIYDQDATKIGELTRIAIAPDGKVWLAGNTVRYKSGLSVLEGANWRVIDIDSQYDAGYSVNDIAFGSGDDVWVGTSLGVQQGLYLYETTSNTWTPIQICDIPTPRVYAVAYNPANGDLWLGLDKANGANLVRLPGGQTASCDTFNKRFDGILVNKITINPADQTVWIATENFGAYRWRPPDNPGAEWIHYPPNWDT